MLNEKDFKTDYTKYANLNKLEVSDKILNKKWKYYKEGTPKDSINDDKSLISMNPKSSINIKISDTLDKIKELRESKKFMGKNFRDKKLLKDLSKELGQLRIIKKNEKIRNNN